MTRLGRTMSWVLLVALLGGLTAGCASEGERAGAEPVHAGSADASAAAHASEAAATPDASSVVTVSGAADAGGLEPGGTRDDRDARMAWWREARFGLFIHWGLYAIPAGQWGERDTHAEWIRTTAQIPLDEYAELAPRFDPVDFDADAWVRAARDAGMQYLVITTKHHDGFALFDSEVSDWDVGASPFEGDVMADIAEACRAHGMALGWYHSIMDWHHPDYLPRRGWETERSTEGADFARYVEFLHAQVTELLTRYGPIDVMWFDGEWEATWTHEHGLELYALCRALQPDVLVNNRVDKGRGGMQGLTVGEQYVGDFGTPEQEIPDTGLPGVDWETCMTMNRYWGWNRADEQWKSTTDLVQKLCDIASKGGNFLLNVGPTERGAFPPRALERLAAIGDWMDVYGESIHGTQAGPFGQLPWGRCTTREVDGGTRLYLQVFDWPEDGALFVPRLGSAVRRAWRVADPGASLQSEAIDDGVWLRGLPAEPDDPHASVLAVDLAGPVVVDDPPEILAESDVFVERLRLVVQPPPGLHVVVTTDGSEPRLPPDADVFESVFESAFEARAVVLGDTATVKARSVRDGRLVGPTVTRTFTAVQPWPARWPDGELAAGLRQTLARGDFEQLPTTLRPDELQELPVVLGLLLEPEPQAEQVARQYDGWLQVPETGVWRFALSSDDGSRLWIDGQLVVDNDGLHGPEVQLGRAPLAEGWHELTVAWFNRTGGAQLSLDWGRVSERVPYCALGASIPRLPPTRFEPVPAEAFAHVR